MRDESKEGQTMASCRSVSYIFMKLHASIMIKLYLGFRVIFTSQNFIIFFNFVLNDMTYNQRAESGGENFAGKL